jgi:signal peptidase I
MNFDFSLMLVILTFVSGFVWAIDSLFLKPRRLAELSENEILKQEEIQEPIWVEYARSFFPVFLIVLILRSFIVEPFRIPSASMMPTLLIGDFILVNKYDYGIRLPVLNYKIISNNTPQRGDVVVFRYPKDPSIPYIKRLIGVSGDHIEYKNKIIYINDIEQKQTSKGAYEAVGSGMRSEGDFWITELLDETTHDILTAKYGRPAMDYEFTVPDGEYLVFGDNRDNSQDSRYWGFVPDENLVGRAFYIWMNWDCNTMKIWNCKSGGIGWSRIGTILE